MSPQADGKTAADFGAYYLQRATQELSNDLDKVREADDFKPDSIAFLVQALQQGASQFSEDEQKRILEAREGRS